MRWPAATPQGVVPRCRGRECAAPCDSHWFYQWFSSFSYKGQGVRPGPGRSGRRGQGRAPGFARAPWQQQKRRARINQFILALVFAAARALFCRVGCLLPQWPVTRQAAAVSLIFHWFFHGNQLWRKACSGGARRCWRGDLGHLAAASVSSISKNHRFRDIFTWSASYVCALRRKHVYASRVRKHK